MRKIIFFLLIITYNQTFAQQKKDSCCITNKELVGTWQRDSKVIGSGLNQNFVFYGNGTFVLNLVNEGEDARSLIKLKGKYRVTKDELYLTILSKTILEGELEIAGMGSSLSLIQFGAKSKIREIKEPSPKEFIDPCYITRITRSQIKLNNELYYKLK